MPAAMGPTKGPLTRMIPTPPTPGAVAMAAMVSVSTPGP